MRAIETYEWITYKFQINHSFSTHLFQWKISARYDDVGNNVLGSIPFLDNSEFSFTFLSCILPQLKNIIEMIFFKIGKLRIIWSLSLGEKISAIWLVSARMLLSIFYIFTCKNMER